MKKKIGVYRFYNTEKSEHGKAFGLCEEHAKNYKAPSKFFLRRITDDGNLECACCWNEEDLT